VELLVVEDDELIASSLVRALTRRGHSVDWLADGLEVEGRLKQGSYDFVILDLGLPGMEGQEVLCKLRRGGDDVPILVLTARDDPDDRVRALDAGADDYLLKPFDLRELEARIRAIRRRSDARPGDDPAVGLLRLRVAECRIERDGQPLQLTRCEYAVLECLMRRQDRVVTKAGLRACTADWSDSESEDAVEILIHRVRRKIGDAAVELVTVRGFGYLLREAASSGGAAGASGGSGSSGGNTRATRTPPF
jgi:DNA-binding response OmpR family regulator